MALWLLLWQGLSWWLARMWPNGHLLLASPVSSLVRLGQLAVTPDFWQTIGFSAIRIFSGFLLSSLIAVVLAIVSARLPRVRELLAPLISAIKSIPVVSFVILALVWLDSDSLPLFISALMVFPTVYLNVLEGMNSVDRQLLEMAQVFRIPTLRRYRGIYLPAVLPYYRSASSAALGLCWKSGIAADVIGLADGSIGEALYNAKVYFMTPDLFAWTAVIVMVSIAMEKGFLFLLDCAARKAGCK